MSFSRRLAALAGVSLIAAPVLGGCSVDSSLSSGSHDAGNGVGGSAGGAGGAGGAAGMAGTSGSGGSGGSMGGSGGSMGGSGGSMGGTGGAGGGTGGASGAGGSSACSPSNPSACPGGTCSKPGALYTQTIYCPFSSLPGSAPTYCTPGTQHCCEGLTSGQLSVCDSIATACPSGWTDWVCQQTSDCGPGMQCCASGVFVMSSESTCANYATGFSGTQCETACATGQIRICAVNAECASGQTCTPFSVKGADLGACE